MRVEEGFQQAPYPAVHPYTADPLLPGLLKRILPTRSASSGGHMHRSHHRDRTLSTLETDLVRLGDVLANDIRPLAPLVQPATLTQYDEFGRRIDRLHTSEGWRKLEEFAIREGYNAIAYEREHGEHSRTYQFARTLLMTGDSHVIMCPMGMTDGAARVIELYGTEEMKSEILPHLLSRDPATAYLSGQWMTERPGGSDLSLTETHATPTKRIPSDLGPPYILDGFKWFSSVADGHIAIALARTGAPASGTRGLSLFLIPLRTGTYASPLANGILIHRLKHKVGTWGVPTAELELRGTRAWLLGEEGAGVKTVAAMLNVTRVHSAAHSLGSLHRCLALACAYAGVRAVQGSGGRTLLRDVPLHVSGLADVALLYKALVHVVFGTVALLGKSECGTASGEDEGRLRLLTPTIKAYAAEKAPGGMLECMAALGGLGYMEETGIGRLIRDAMVEKIWEGTVNVCALDLTRAATKDPDAIASFTEWAYDIVAAVPPLLRERLRKPTDTLSAAISKLPDLFRESAANPLMPRLVLNHFAALACAVYLLEHATWAYAMGEHTVEEDSEAFRRWVSEGDLTKTEVEVATVREEPYARAELNSKLLYGTQAKL